MPCHLSSLLIRHALPRSDSSRFGAINVINVVFTLEESPESRERERGERGEVDLTNKNTTIIRRWLYFFLLEIFCLLEFRIFFLLALFKVARMDVVKLSGYMCRDGNKKGCIARRGQGLQTHCLPLIDSW